MRRANETASRVDHLKDDELRKDNSPKVLTGRGVVVYSPFPAPAHKLKDSRVSLHILDEKDGMRTQPGRLLRCT